MIAPSYEGFNPLEAPRERSRMNGGNTSWKKCRSCESRWILQISEEFKAECLPTL
jgi:hypothetical protein